MINLPYAALGLWSGLRNFLQNPSDTTDFGQRMEAAAQRNEADQSNKCAS